MRLLPIGTVVNYKDVDLIVCGYTLTEAEAIFACYRTVIYPFGFTEPEKIILLPVKDEYSIVYEGYRDEEFERVSRIISKRFSILDGVTEQDIKTVLKRLDSIERSMDNE